MRNRLREAYMQDPLAKAYRYRKVAVEFSNLAKRTSSDFSRAYYQRIAQQYQMLADSELGLRQADATMTGGNPASFSSQYFHIVVLPNGLSSRVQVFS